MRSEDAREDFTPDPGELAWERFLISQDAAMSDTCRVCHKRKIVSQWPLCPACHGARIGANALRDD